MSRVEYYSCKYSQEILRIIHRLSASILDTPKYFLFEIRTNGLEYTEKFPELINKKETKYGIRLGLFTYDKPLAYVK